jgi:membrane-associated protease RseP (regulator of RpoE activity)
MPAAAIDGMFQAQCTWDATMAWNALRALQAEPDPGAIMVVLLGSGHVAFGLGAQRQAARYASLPMATVIPIPLVDEDGKPARARASYADYLWTLPPESPLPLYPTIGVSLADRKGVPHPVVSSVSANSLAALAGVQAEDRLVSFDGAPLPDKEAYLARLSTKSWGDRITLVVERAGKSLTLPIPLARLQTKPAR